MLGGAIYWMLGGQSKEEYVQEEKKPDVSSKLDPANMAYSVEGNTFELVNGHAAIAVPDIPGIMNELSIFGKSVYGDLDGDGDMDAAVWLVNEPGGTGVFYYGALVLNESPVRTTTAVFLGDRISPESIIINGDVAEYHFLDRETDEPYTAEPTVTKVKELRAQ